MERLGPEFFDRTFDAITLTQLLRQKPAAFAVALRLARIARSHQAIEAVIDSLTTSFQESGVKGSVIGTLPIAAMADLQWLAEETRQPDLKAALGLLFGRSELEE